MNSAELSPQSIAFECDDGTRHVLHLFRSGQQSPNKSTSKSPENSTHQSDAAAALTPVVVVVPVMSLNFTEDTFAPLVATRHLVEKLNPSDWQRHLFDPHALGSSRADHYEWMRYPALPAQKLASWALTLK